MSWTQNQKMSKQNPRVQCFRKVCSRLPPHPSHELKLSQKAYSAYATPLYRHHHHRRGTSALMMKPSYSNYTYRSYRAAPRSPKLSATPLSREISLLTTLLGLSPASSTNSQQEPQRISESDQQLGWSDASLDTAASPARSVNPLQAKKVARTAF